MTAEQVAGSEVFSLQLLREAEGEDLRVITAEVTRRGFRHRLMFGEDNHIRDVLQTDFASFLTTELDRIPFRSPRVIERPDLVLPLPGLMLGRMRLIVGHNGTLQHRVIVRFRYFIGGVQNAFDTKCYFDRPALEHRDEIGVRALEDVAMPLLNMANFSRAFPGLDQIANGMSNALGSIEKQASELEFYASLLRRYVQECGIGRTTEVQKFTDPVSRVLAMEEPPNLFRPKPPGAGKTAG